MRRSPSLPVVPGGVSDSSLQIITETATLSVGSGEPVAEDSQVKILSNLFRLIPALRQGCQIVINGGSITENELRWIANDGPICGNPVEPGHSVRIRAHCTKPLIKQAGATLPFANGCYID